MELRMNLRRVTITLLAGCLFSWLPTAFAMDRTKRNLKIVAWLAAAGIAHQMSQPAQVSFGQALHEKTGLTIRDIAHTATLAATVMAASYAFGPRRRAKIQHFATRYPLAALLGKLATCKALKQSTQNIPVLNWYLGCQNSECSGSCNYCTLKSMFIFVGIMKLIL